MPGPLRVAYTVEQCWHAVPGGTATATVEVGRRIVARAAAESIELIGVAGRHRQPPDDAFEPPVPVVSLPIARPWLYESWNRINWPKVERSTGAIDVCHSTLAIPAATDARHVVTVHDVAFMHTPERFSGHGSRVMRAGLERCRHADLILCPSRVTMDDLVELGFDRSRLRLVPWGVDAAHVSDGDRERVTRRYALPGRFVLFVGTVEPRKNLTALTSAVARAVDDAPLVIAGAAGWGDAAIPDGGARFVGFVPPGDLPALYSLATVFAYPSLQEGFGLPVAEAMSYGTPVVTSSGTATEEVAGGAAVLVDPHDIDSIAAGIDAAVARTADLRAAGLARAAALTWDATVDATIAAYREVV
ncbi:MAG: glycosyltransferase family 1 protein [Ilumatobacteraceae bacterium]